MKKKVSLMIGVLVVVAMLMILPTQVEAKNSVTYTLKKGTLTISGKGKMPKKMRFQKNKKIKKVVIKKGVTSISDRAFYQCKNLKKAKIASTVKTIGNWAFYETKLQEVKFPKSLKTIGNRAFMKTKIKSVKIPNKVTTIGSSAFYNCRKLSKATIGKKVKTIKKTAFASTAIKNITIPKSVKKIGNGALVTHGGLNSITMPGDFQRNDRVYKVLNSKKVIFSTPLDIKNAQLLYTENFQISGDDPNFVSINGYIYTKDRKTLVRVPAGVSNVKVEDGCETICLSALQYNEEFNIQLRLCDRKLITELIIPKSVTKIDDKSYMTYDAADDPLLWKKSVVIEKINVIENTLPNSELLKLTSQIQFNGTL